MLQYTEDDHQPLTEDQRILNNEFLYKMDRDPHSVNYPGLRTQERNEITETFEDLALKDKKKIEENRKRVNG